MTSYQQHVLPRWRGFNLLGAFVMSSPGKFSEDEFRFTSDLGFDFVRLPLNYTFWIDDNDPFKINENKLDFLDEAIRWGERYGLHIQLNFHRAPGYSVAGDRIEPFDLWTDEEAQEAFRLHWEMITKRYQGITSDRLSFNLINEPHDVEEGLHNQVLIPVIDRIQEISPDRLIIMDGLDWGTEPNAGLVLTSDSERRALAQSCRAYAPHPFTHYKAEWADPDPNQVEPSWPYINQYDLADRWDEERIYKEFESWAKFASEKAVGVHCGEGGAYRHTSHQAVLAWMEAVLSALKSFNIGFSLWNLDGPFGILNSERADVQYEDYHGHQLDREMLKLLQKY